jgi:hypothetical protein
MTVAIGTAVLVGPGEDEESSLKCVESELAVEVIQNPPRRRHGGVIAPRRGTECAIG